MPARPAFAGVFFVLRSALTRGDPARQGGILRPARGACRCLRAASHRRWPVDHHHVARQRLIGCELRPADARIALACNPADSLIHFAHLVVVASRTHAVLAGWLASIAR